MISAPPPLKLDEAVARVLHKLVVSAFMLLKAARGSGISYLLEVRGNVHCIASPYWQEGKKLQYILSQDGYYNLIFQETRPLRILFNLVNCAYLHFILWKMIQLSSK